MADVCGDNRLEIIAKVKEHLIKATNIEMHPEELAQVDNILFRLWQLNYFNQCNLVNCSGRENKIELIKTKKKLDKAKEIIKNLLDDTYHFTQHYPIIGNHKKYIYDKLEAEDFLKEQKING